MSKYKDIKTLLRALVGNENSLNNNVLFIDFTGSHEKAQYLSQLYYWSNRTKIPGGWIAKRHEDWHEEIRIKAHSIRRFSKEFHSKGFLDMKLKKFNGVTMPHYKLDQDLLIDQLLTFCKGNKLSTLQNVNLGVTNCQPSQDNKLSTSINRDYTETTTENTRERTHAEKSTKNPKKEKPELTAEATQPSKKVPPKKVSEPVHENDFPKDDSELTVENMVAIPEPSEVADGMFNYYTIGDGSGTLSMILSSLNIDSIHQIDFRKVCVGWALKYSDEPFTLRDWKNKSRKTLLNWVANEHRSNKFNQAKIKSLNKGNTNERLKVGAFGSQPQREIVVSKVPV